MSPTTSAPTRESAASSVLRRRSLIAGTGENEEVGEQIRGNEERRERKKHEPSEKNAPEHRRIAELLEPEEIPQKLRHARQENNGDDGPAEPGSKHCQTAPHHARGSQIVLCASYNRSRAGALALSLDKGLIDVGRWHPM